MIQRRASLQKARLRATRVGLPIAPVTRAAAYVRGSEIRASHNIVLKNGSHSAYSPPHSPPGHTASAPASTGASL